MSRLIAAAALLASIALVAPAGAAAAGCEDAGIVPTDSNLDGAKAATLCLLNEQRAARGLRPLRSSRQLAEAARAHSANMVRQRFFDHVCPQGSTVTSRIRQTSYLRGRYRGWSVGENIAWGSGYLATPREIVRGWMRSRGHRDNILERRYRNIGIGIVPAAPAAVGSRRAATYTADFGYRTRG